MLGFLQRNSLLFVVFLTGAAVLVLEIAATRILSPFFGNTIFTVSSVISVILFALSIGYAFGGRLADKRGTELLFYQIIALSGLSVFLLHILSLFVLPGLSAALSLREGPLFTAMLLFFLPGLLLGMLSPFVVKLQKERAQRGIGQTAGDVFFWSTLGSITGSLATGFYLIPTFGVAEIIVGVGVALLVIGILGMVSSKQSTLSGGKVLLLLSVLPFMHIALVMLGEVRTSDTLVHASDGVYDSIVIYDDEYSGQPARFLQQATDASSAMYLDSDELVYDYTKYYAVYQLIDPDIERALVIGGGAYSVPKALLQDDADVVVDVAEIEPDLYELGKRYFQVPDDQRLRNHVEDGRRFLQRSEGDYDVIFADAFHASIPSHLATQEFFAMSRSKLSSDGVFVMNIIGSLDEQHPSFLFSELKTFESVYPNRYFFAVYSPEENFLQNIIMVGVNGDEKLSFDTEDSFLTTLPDHLIAMQRYDLEPYPIFTDNYAPVEYFISNRLTE